jgi:hypothetical protein
MLDRAQAATELEWCRRLVGLEEWTEQASTHLGAEGGDADALGGEGIGVGAAMSIVGEVMDQNVPINPPITCEFLASTAKRRRRRPCR